MENETERTQQIQNSSAGRNSTQVGGDYTHTTTVNLSFWISIGLGITLAAAFGGYVLMGADWSSVPNINQEMPDK